MRKALDETVIREIWVEEIRPVIGDYLYGSPEEVDRLQEIFCGPP
jgi:hypothetical protein